MKEIIIAIFVIGAIIGVLAWSDKDHFSEAGIAGQIFGGITGGIGCVWTLLPILLVVMLIMYCCS